MNTLFRAVAIAAAMGAATISVNAQAGQFRTEYWGDATGTDIAQVVTDKFTEAYPVAKYKIWLMTDVGTNGQGDVYCTAIAGVTLRHTHETPVNRYSETIIRHNGGSPTVGQRHALAAQCARGAVNNMMSDKMSNIYAPYKE